ncbi:MAG: hypothetical protein HYV96_12180 [Opitutae bacterium]|nr:hypothetical protein [Opitutae bacterium]
MHDIIIRYIKVCATVALSGSVIAVFLYKVGTSNIGFNASNLSTTDVLSILLALFSVALSVMFYFKGSEESAQFYNHSYTFTKDISQVLGRIEAGFGERLRHLDENYSDVRDRLDGVKVERSKAVEKVKEEEKDVKAAVAERDGLIAQLMERANLGVEEKNAIQQKLAEKEKELDYAKRQLFDYRRRLEELEQAPSDMLAISDDLRAALRELSLTVERTHFLRAPLGWLSRHIQERLPKLSDPTVLALKQHGILGDGGMLTPKGRSLLRKWGYFVAGSISQE